MSDSVITIKNHIGHTKNRQVSRAAAGAAALLPIGPLLALAHVGTAGSLRRPRMAVAAGPRVIIDHWSVDGRPMTAIDSGNNQVS